MGPGDEARATGPSYGKFIHMPHLRVLRGCSLVSSTAAEKQKVGGVSRHRLLTLREVNRPVGRGGGGGLRGFERTPLLASKDFYIHCFNCTF